MTFFPLFATGQSQITDILLWVILTVALIASIVLIYVQRRMGKWLAFELSQLDKIKKNDIEYEFILKTMKLSTWHIDPKTREITFDNDFRVKNNTYSPPSGGTIDDLGKAMSEADCVKLKKVFDDMIEGRIEEGHIEYKIILPQQHKSYWSESYAIVAERDIDGKPITIVGTSQRIDERKEMEQALVEARNRAEESDRLKTAFIANMSHEIRTPLNAIIGFTSIIPDVQSEEERKALLDLVHENTQKLLVIIDDVVNISKVESGKAELVLSAFDLNPVIDESIDSYRAKLAPGVVLNTEYGLPSQMITTDLERLLEILKHLMSNAVKFTNQGSITVGYHAPQNGRIRIFIRDTGKGIAKEHQDRIFDRFYKVDEFIPGAGLGLSICHTMAYSLGGIIGVESELGKGSTFWFEIPIE